MTRRVEMFFRDGDRSSLHISTFCGIKISRFLLTNGWKKDSDALTRSGDEELNLELLGGVFWRTKAKKIFFKKDRLCECERCKEATR